MKEVFVRPAVGAIIEKKENGETYVLMQERQKDDITSENGLLEIPAGKIREYENIFDTLRREVHEETGLKIVKIHGEESSIKTNVRDHCMISFTPFCITQNLCGGYSLLVNVFVCHAEGELLKRSNESARIRWMKLSDLKELLGTSVDSFFPIHINALRKYVGL